MPSLQVALLTRMIKEDNDRLRLQELEDLDEKRLQAQQHIELYQMRILKALIRRLSKGFFRKEIWFWPSDDR